MLIALAVRPRQMPERLSSALERAHRVGILDRLELGALTRREAREFLGDAVEDAASIDLYDESGGNPFYLEQLARSLDRVPEDTSADSRAFVGRSRRTAGRRRSALAEELALLSDDARLVLEGAAVAGDPFEPELAAAAASAPEAVSARGTGRTPTARPHSPDRRAPPVSLPAPARPTGGLRVDAAGWRLGAHERCAGALAALGAPAADRAHHVQRSARQGDSAAVADSARSRRGRSAARARKRRDLVWRRAEAPPRGRSCRGAGRASARPREGAGCDRAVCRGPLRSAREHRAGPRPRRSHYECGSPRRAPASSTCSAATRTLTTRLVSAMESLGRSRITRGSGTDDRARDGRRSSSWSTSVCARGPREP